ncbi:hypothetical protein [Polaromonas sp.]|uniref:hypothetical protein n=1 Tax=Polaromonas sp. TaxID=1869339 RepID=UPI00352AA063
MTQDDKAFSTLAAAFALAGHSLIRAQPCTGQAPYYAARWGWLRPIHSLKEAQAFLEQLEGSKQ